MARPSKHKLIHKATHGQPAAIPPKAPADLSPAAKAEFERVVAISRPGVLTPLDLTILRQYAELAAQLATDPKEFTAAQHTQLRLIAAELGLTPASRAGKLAPPDEKPVDSRWAQFG